MGFIHLATQQFLHDPTCLLSSEAKDPSSEFMKISIICTKKHTFHRPSVSSSGVVTLEDDVKSTATLAKSLAFYLHR